MIYSCVTTVDGKKFYYKQKSISSPKRRISNKKLKLNLSCGLSKKSFLIQSLNELEQLKKKKLDLEDLLSSEISSRDKTYEETVAEHLKVLSKLENEKKDLQNKLFSFKQQAEEKISSLDNQVSLLKNNLDEKLQTIDLLKAEHSNVIQNIKFEIQELINEKNLILSQSQAIKEKLSSAINELELTQSKLLDSIKSLENEKDNLQTLNTNLNYDNKNLESIINKNNESLLEAQNMIIRQQSERESLLQK